MKVRVEKRTFHFKRPSGTSRGILTEKHSWFITLWRTDEPWITGVGECSIIPGLSPEFTTFEAYEEMLEQVCLDPTQDLTDWPSIRFGIETALHDLQCGGQRIIFDNAFSHGERKIPINGLIWMGTEAFMREQIEEKLAEGFTTLKMKIGAIDFDTEYRILASVRERFSREELTLRVDANGAFSPENAARKLDQLSSLAIHSIEQPIAPGQWKEMADLCLNSPFPVALDEELIGVETRQRKIALLDAIRPPFIILKPSLHGGISGCKEWIELAETRHIAWWLTSALESNIGLNAICQLAGEYDNPLPQGLGTGSLYTDNISTGLRVANGHIFLNNSPKRTVR